MWGRRPRVSVWLNPRERRPGETFEVTIALESAAELRIDGIDVSLEGLERVPIQAGKYRSELQSLHVILRATLPACTLPKGSWRTSVRFALPESAPGSYEGTSKIAYELGVHVRIPWALDRRAYFVVPVEHPVRPRGPKEPRTYSTNPGGGGDAELTIEAALADVVVVPGEPLRGTIAIVNAARRKPKRVHVDLITTEQPSTASKPRSIWDAEAPTRAVL